MEACVFCSIIAGDAPASIVYQDELCCAFLDIQPINPGHVLVVPKAHLPGLEDLDPEMAAHLFQIARHIASALRRCGVPCAGINLFLADGEAAGQEIFHFHLHVLPRYKGDGLRVQAGPGYDDLPERAALDQIAAQIRSVI